LLLSLGAGLDSGGAISSFDTDLRDIGLLVT
jgi:hypothetical protein